MFIKEINTKDVPAPELLEHACDICPRTFKTIPGLKRHKTSHSRKPQKDNGNIKYILILFYLF